MHALCIYTSYYPSVGYCIVCFSSGFTTTFYRINEINSTLSFCEYPTIEELYGFELQQIINSNYIVMQTKTVVGYLAPEIEVNYVVVEQGIAASNMEQIGDEKEEIEW